MAMGAATTARSYANVDARIYGGELAYGVNLTSALSLAAAVRIHAVR